MMKQSLDSWRPSSKVDVTMQSSDGFGRDFLAPTDASRQAKATALITAIVTTRPRPGLRQEAAH
jgi:hypothetical protein